MTLASSSTAQCHFLGVAKAEAVTVPQSTACQPHNLQSPQALCPQAPILVCRPREIHTLNFHYHRLQTRPLSPSSKSKKAFAPSLRVPLMNACRTCAVRTHHVKHSGVFPKLKNAAKCPVSSSPKTKPLNHDGEAEARSFGFSLAHNHL